MAGDRVHYGWFVILTGLAVTIGAHGFGRMSYTLILPASLPDPTFHHRRITRL